MKQVVTKTKERNHHLDNAKFWLLVLIIFTHVIQPGIATNPLIKAIYLFFYAFHIPVFAFISGYFSKKKPSSKGLLKVFFLYILFQLIYSFFTNLPFDLITPHWVLWYLLSLLTWRMILPYCLKLKYPFIISILASLLIGLLPSIDTALSLSQTFYFLPFFILGYLLSQKKSWQPFLFHRFRLIRIILFILSFVGLIFLTPLLPQIDHQWLQGDKAYAFVLLSWQEGMLVRLVQYGLAFLLMFFFFAVIPFSKNKLTSLGQRSLYVFAWHGLLLLWWHKNRIPGLNDPWIESGFPFLLDGWPKILFTLIASFILTLILSMKWIEKLTLFFWQPFCRWIFNK